LTRSFRPVGVDVETSFQAAAEVFRSGDEDGGGASVGGDAFSVFGVVGVVG